MSMLLVWIGSETSHHLGEERQKFRASFQGILSMVPKLGSAIRKINFYKSNPLPLWDVHCGIPLLDPP